MKGRKNKPTALKILQGNPGKRRMPENEPKPELISNIPIPPIHIVNDQVASAEWTRIITLLICNNMITGLDLTIVSAYCTSFSFWVDTLEQIKLSGLTDNAKKGKPKITYLWYAHQQAQTAMLKCAQELGLSPVSRPKIKTISKQKTDSMEEFLSD